MLESAKTNIVAKPMPKPFNADVVTPNVGHIPKSITNVGFSRIMPLVKFSLLVLSICYLLWLNFLYPSYAC